MQNYISSVFLILLVNFSVYSSQGKVVVARGSSTMLAPHTLKAVALKKGDIVKEDSSIVTQQRSFIKILMDDGTNMMIGPNSKMVVSVNRKDGTLLNLLKGKIRVIAAEKKENHLFIKTRTAALGVRGTDFVTTFNPDSRRTSLLTFEGKVAISKEINKIKIMKEDKDRVETINNIDKLLNDKVTHATKAEFTTIGVVESKPIVPVKINPTQFVLLKNDESLGSVKQKFDAKKISVEVQELTKEITASGLATNEGLKHGGFISQEMGLYVPPKDETSKSKVGKIDTNGKFLAPEGLKLDAYKGFVAKNKEDKVAQIQAKNINDSLGEQVLVDKNDPMYKRYFDVE